MPTTALAIPLPEALGAWAPVAVFMALAGLIGLALLASSFVAAPQRPDAAKSSPYECGFEPFDDARMRFDVQFYLVAILFIVFDLEVAFLFPWAVAFYDVGWSGYGSVALFLSVLGVGFVYEWRKGALDWR